MTRISQLPTTGFPSLEHEFPASKDGETVRLTVQQVRDLLAYQASEIARGSSDVAADLSALENDKADQSYVDAADNSLSDAVATKLNRSGDNVGSNGPALRAAIGAIGNLRSVVIITASGTYTPDAAVKAIRARGCGGGGGSGAVDGQNAPSARSLSCAGSGASYFEIFVPAADLATSYTCTIGAGGAAGAVPSGSGGNGGITTFTDGTKTVSVIGGRGGEGMQATSLSRAASLVSEPGSNTLTGFNGFTRGNDISTPTYILNGVQVSISKAGSNPLGSGGISRIAGSGSVGVGYGAGGGASGTGQNDATDFAGAAGTQGVIIIEEFI
jgi:hypothetical protein